MYGLIYMKKSTLCSKQETRNEQNAKNSKVQFDCDVDSSWSERIERS